MGKGFDHRSRRAFQQVGDANSDRSTLQPHVAVGIGKGFEFNYEWRQRSARPDLAMHAAEDLHRALEEQRTRHIHGSHNERLSKQMIRAKISALGCYVPPRVLTNADLERLVDTNHEWIHSRVGISERRIAEPDIATS